MSDKIREEFEAEYMNVNHPHVSFSDAGNIVKLRKCGGEVYCDPMTANAFFWFCRSRASLCVEIPKRDEYSEMPYGAIEIFEVQQALDTAGVRYK